MNSTKVARQTAAGFVIVALVGMGQAASAYTPGACRQDAEKLCPGLKGKEVMPCLKQRQGELSTACQVNLAEARQVVRDAKDACQPDIQKFCANVAAGQGRILKCLKAHESELAPACRDQLLAARRKYRPDAAPEPPGPPPAAK